MRDQPESLIIRPPSEWRSLLVRITRGCNWNRCRFCGIYPAMGQREFSSRSLAEIRHDLDLLIKNHPGMTTAFFGDADPLAAGMEIFIGAAGYLRSLAPITRLTCYGRLSTLYRLGRQNVHLLARAGLNRIHIGLESGDPEVLRFQRKGQSPEMAVMVCQWLRDAGIEISLYVLLGLGGRDKFEQHINATARLLNAVAPEFVRLRRLWLYEDGMGRSCPLLEQVRDGSFVEQTPEGTVLELKLLLELLDPMNTFLACDHTNNYIRVSGMLNEDKVDMLAEVEDFLRLPEVERRAVYQDTGSRI